jgi:hypothetical protein
MDLLSPDRRFLESGLLDFEVAGPFLRQLKLLTEDDFSVRYPVISAPVSFVRPAVGTLICDRVEDGAVLAAMSQGVVLSFAQKFRRKG